ncbi:MAG: arginine--tRNA ligase [Candidatus Gastranaerophilaceae bacterium]|jgi:arginyl-tRNA synthetase
MFKQEFQEYIIEAVSKAIKEEKLGGLTNIKDALLIIEKPKNPEFGDIAVNISPLAKFAKISPPQIAQTILSYTNFNDAQTSVMGGFINIKLGKSWLNRALSQIINEKENFGKNNLGNKEKVLLEYVSANPTGPLHIGHGRWAAMGSALANLLKISGFDVTQEFYINDEGNQINNLAKSLWIRVLQQLGINAAFPTDEIEAKNYYSGDYLIDTAQTYVSENSEKAKFLAQKNTDYLNPSDEILKEMASFAKAKMLQAQKNLLETLRVDFQNYYSETSLHLSGKVGECVNKLQNKGEIYEKDEALWFCSSKYGDDQDRVIKKTDGSNTYLTADIAYHLDKLERGYERLINIWGADHHGYVARIKASIEALGYNPNKLEILLGQLVNLIISGEQVRMGKRKKMITLEDLVNEVGVDATRFWMIMRSIDTTLDFDVDLAKSNTDENPVFYVQYAHARCNSILRHAIAPRFDTETKEQLPSFLTEEELKTITEINGVNFDYLWTDDEKALNATKSLVLKLESFSDVVLGAAKARAPYMIARYAQELAGDFHHFYSFARVLNVENNLSKSRLALVYATKVIIANSLNILGVSAPKSM